MPALLLAAHAAFVFLRKRLKQSEGDVCRLICFRVCAGDVTREGARRAPWRRFFELQPGGTSGGVQAREPARRDRFNIALDARDLSGEKERAGGAHLECRRDDPRRADVSITMNLSELQEFRLG